MSWQRPYSAVGEARLQRHRRRFGTFSDRDPPILARHDFGQVAPRVLAILRLVKSCALATFSTYLSEFNELNGGQRGRADPSAFELHCDRVIRRRPLIASSGCYILGIVARHAFDGSHHLRELLTVLTPLATFRTTGIAEDLPSFSCQFWDDCLVQWKIVDFHFKSKREPCVATVRL